MTTAGYSLEDWEGIKEEVYHFIKYHGQMRLIDLMAEYDLSMEEVEQMMTEISAEHPEVKKLR